MIRNARKVMRLDAATWPLKLGFWWTIGLVDLVSLLLVVVGFADEAMSILSVVTVGTAASTITSPFFSNRKYGTDGMLATMPFQRIEIVLGHFFYGLSRILTLEMNLFAIFVLTMEVFHADDAVNPLILFNVSSSLLLLSILILSYPLIFNFAFQQALLLVVAVIVSFGLIAMLIVPVTNVAKLIRWLTVMDLSGLGLLMVIGLLVSIWLSIKFYDRKEF